MTRRRLLSSGGGAAALVLAVTLAPPVQLTPVADNGLMFAGETRLVSLGNDPDPEAPPVVAPAVSDTGRFVAYQRGSIYYYDTGSSIWLRDQATGQEERISPAEGTDTEGTNTAPSISGDGGLVAYTSATGVYAVDRTDPDQPVRHRVSGARRDLEFQRTVPCTPTLEPDTVSEGGCGPVLSGDGTSIAFPTRLSLVSPSLEPTVAGEEGLTYLDSSQHGLAVLDFRERSGESGSLTLQREVRVRVAGAEPVTFRQPTISSDGSFELFDADNRCVPGQAVDPGEECTIGVQFTRPAFNCVAEGTSYGLLRVNSPTASGQSAVALVGDHQTSCPVDIVTATANATALAAACADSGDLPVEQFGQEDPGFSSTVNMREVDVGQTYVAIQEVSNTNSDVDERVQFTSSDCSAQLVEPEATNSDVPSPCFDGVILEFGDSCTAYVRYQPESVSPTAATLTVSFESSGQQGPDRRFRFVGAGAHNVVAMRRDQSGQGNFAGPTRLVSVDAEDVAMRGAAPSLSADGRYVAFVSGFSWSVGDQDPFADNYQVYVHDTDRNGNRTYLPGETTNVSLVEGSEGELQAEYGVQPSLSGDGSRIAFVDVDVAFGEGGVFVDSAQVHVRDLATGVSKLVSVPTVPTGSGDPADGISHRPSLSRDGSTVAFTSDAEELLPAGVLIDGDWPQVYVRDLARDFDGAGVPRTDIVSLKPADFTAGTHAGMPAVDADGGVITFASNTSLTDVTHINTQVYARIRYGGPSVSPLALKFPPQEIGTTGPVQAVTVSNSGPGPMRVVAETDGPFEISNGCAGASVHRRESCQVLIAFAPVAPGTVTGVVTIRMTSFGWDGDEQVITVTGVGVQQQFRLVPGRIDFPEEGIGRTGPPVVVRAVNTTTHALDFTARIESGDEDAEATIESAREEVQAISGSEDFAVAGQGGGAAGCSAVQPDGVCRLLVSFTPTTLDPSTGRLAVVATTSGQELMQFVDLTGETAEPLVEISPTVAREGRVVFISGSNFLPGENLVLLWSGGQAVIPAVVPDSEGEFSAPVVILPGRRAGVHLLSVAMPGLGTFDGPPVIVVPGSLQPPDFSSRN